MRPPMLVQSPSPEVQVVAFEEGLCTLILNRPERNNALSGSLLEALRVVLERVAAAEEARVVVLTGQGEKAFSGGYEIAELSAEALEAMDTGRIPHPLHLATEALARCPVPTLALIRGVAMGGGLDLALACDIRIAADNARFCMPPARFGILYHYRGIQRFLRAVGPAHTMELFFTGRQFDAARAREIGLVSHVLPLAAVEAFTYELAREIAANAPLSVTGTKAIVRRHLESWPLTAEDEAAMLALIARCARSEDLREGTQALVERRPGRFVGR
ncbi:MAG: enoyl-CoA hydratase/isomerase family protein [Deltaproteobacteria bacterium]|nr:enoyl-CoA hydratase/isomerase family protein [Deltaproteobacteria bacterium]